MPTAHVFIATSLDGFIARDDGSIDWLLARDAAQEDHGYDAFIANIDGIIMGRGSFEVARHFDPWPYHLPVFVLSATLTPDDVPVALQRDVRVFDLTPRDMLLRLEAEGHLRIYVDGGKVVQSFLAEGLVDDLVLTRVPVLLGHGRPLRSGSSRRVARPRRNARVPVRSRAVPLPCLAMKRGPRRPRSQFARLVHRRRELQSAVEVE